jgi:Kef-type K+ transport system membrane component KefB
MTDTFVQLSAVVGLAVFLAMIMRLLKQPMMIGYILTGILAGPLVFNFVRPGDHLDVFSHLGVSLLLFLVGLGLDPKNIRDVGPIAVITGMAQMAVTFVFGFAIAVALNFAMVSALYLAIAFTFSSTIIVLRILQEKESEDSLYGRIAIGFLLVQDLAAMIIFVFVGALNDQSSLLTTILLLTAKFALVVLGFVLLSKYVIPTLERRVGDNKELLFLSALAICFLCSAAFTLLGFSRELGALAAGLLLSRAVYFREVGTRIQPLRDFFLVVFFVYIGANMVATSLSSVLIPVVIFSAFILIGNPLILLFIMVRQGYTRKTSFFVGLTVAQISEFSLILISIAMSLGHVDASLLTITTFVGLTTIALCSYMMTYNERLYEFLFPLIKRLTPNAHERDTQDDLADANGVEVLLFGAHRLGGGLLERVREEGVSYLVIDHDPHLIQRLKEQHVVAHFGSADDAVFLDTLDFSKLKLVISTIPDQEVSMFLAGYLKHRRPSVSFIAVAHHQSHAEQLYDAGACYVVMPPYLGRRFMVDLFKKNLFNATKYAQEKSKHLKDLRYIQE